MPRIEPPDVTLEGIGMGRRGAAFKFQADDWDEAEFLPWSQIEVTPVTDSGEHGRCVVTIRGWLAAKNGWG